MHCIYHPLPIIWASPKQTLFLIFCNPFDVAIILCYSGVRTCDFAGKLPSACFITISRVIPSP